MAQLGKLSGTITDSQGNPVSGASIEVRTQGGYVNGAQAGPTYNVDNIGGLTVGQQVKVNATGTVTRNVSAATVATVTTSGPGLGALNDGDRITVVSTLPTIYSDEAGNNTKANPLTSDASGYWECFAPVIPYDLLESGTNYGTKLRVDVVPMGVEDLRSNVFSGNATAPYRRSTVRTLTAGNLETVENPTGTAKRTLDYAGNETLTGGLTASGNVGIGGTLSVTGTSTFTGAIGAATFSGLITANAGITSAAPFTYSGAAGSYTLTAGSVETADLAANAVTQTYVGTGTTDQVLSGGAVYTDVVSATVTFTPFSAASEITIMAVAPIESNAGAAYFAFARIVDATAATIYHESGAGPGPLAINQPISVALVARVTGLTGSQTFKMQAKTLTNDGIIKSNTTDMKARIVVVEHKK